MEKFNLEKSQITILVVDDEPLLSEFVTRLLASEGFQTASAKNGEEACKILESDAIDLIISDIRMPKMDGVALLDHVNKHFQTIPVILMTGYSSLSIEEALSKGAKCVLGKPFKTTLLFETVKNALVPAVEKWRKSKPKGEKVEFTFDSSEESQFADSLKFGNGGFNIRTSKPLNVGTQHLFKITFSDDPSKLLQISGKVLWSNYKEANLIEYGVEILAANEEAIEFLLNHLKVSERQSFIPAA